VKKIKEVKRIFSLFIFLSKIIEKTFGQ